MRILELLKLNLGWVAFGKLRDDFSSAIPQFMKTKVIEQCLLPSTTYGSEMWSLTTCLIKMLKVHSFGYRTGLHFSTLGSEMRRTVEGRKLPTLLKSISS